jgi:hypothetical protein
VAKYVQHVKYDAPDLDVNDIEYATWPDANGLCWWRCEWDPDDFDLDDFDKGTRIQVLRTSESRLLAETDEVSRQNLPGKLGPRADRLRELATNNRRAFAPDHAESYDATKHDHHDVSIKARSRDLHLVTIVSTGPTGERANWPDSKDKFAVIAARQLAPVPQPRLNADPEDVKVNLHLSLSGGLKRVRVWRTTRSDIDDLRKMHPLKPIELGNGDPSITDTEVEPSTWYAYRAVAEASDGRRSSPTGPVWVKTGRPWTVTGTVVDAQTGEPLPGVNVVHVEDIQQGKATERDGTFRLDVNSRDAELRLSFTGYETKVVPLEGRSEITVELSPSA